jgi:hypothetical protein
MDSYSMLRYVLDIPSKEMYQKAFKELTNCRAYWDCPDFKTRVNALKNEFYRDQLI